MGTTAPIAGAKRRDMWMSEPEILTVIDDPTHSLYDKRAFKKITPLFVKSISSGVIEPIICIERTIDGVCKVIVVAGRRRRQAACLVNVQRLADGLAPMRVPFTLLPPGTSDADCVRVMNKENGQRENESSLAKGRKAKISLSLGHTLEEVAEDANATTTAVGQWLKVLADGAPELIKAIDDGKIKFTPGFGIVSECKTKDAQVAALQSLLGGNGSAVSAETEGSTETEGGGKKAKQPTGKQARAKASGKGLIPGRRHLKKLVKLEKTELSKDFVLALEWLTGGVRTQQIAGLTKALRDVGFGE